MVCRVLERPLCFIRSVVLRDIKIITRTNNRMNTHWRQEGTVERRIEHLRDICRSIGQIEFNLAEFLIPKCDRLLDNLFKGRAADLGLGVAACLLRRLE